MPDSLRAEDLREGLCVYECGRPDRAGNIVSWSLGCSPDQTTVTVKWLGHPSTATPLASLKHFGRFVSDLHAKFERYGQLLDELRQIAAASPAKPSSGERRDCLTCGHKDAPMGDPPCITCRPVTGAAVNWTRANCS